MDNDFTLCSNHNFIKENLKILKRMFKNNSEALKLIDESLIDVAIAKKQGRRMENRLKVYRKNIEKCGFKRNK